jgi:ribose 5-phosphate isomerase B
MKQWLIEKSMNQLDLNLIDLGANSPESCHYPIFAKKLSNNMLQAEGAYGILICSTGIGMAIAANRHKWIRAALCFNEKMAELSRRHNDANVIVFGASVIDSKTALSCLRAFLDTPFDGGRHRERLELIDG